MANGSISRAAPKRRRCQIVPAVSDQSDYHVTVFDSLSELRVAPSRRLAPSPRALPFPCSPHLASKQLGAGPSEPRHFLNCDTSSYLYPRQSSTGSYWPHFATSRLYGLNAQGRPDCPHTSPTGCKPWIWPRPTTILMVPDRRHRSLITLIPLYRHLSTNAFGLRRLSCQVGR